MSYLGHIVGQGFRRPLDVKIAAVVDCPQPVNKTSVRDFLGLCCYYQRYIPNYSQLANPLTDALRKNEAHVVKWDETKENFVRALKKALTCKPVLTSPDYTRTFIVQCDVSDRGIGAVLFELDERGRERPVLYIIEKGESR